MTEVEKLKALLAAAYEALHCEDDGDGVTSHRCGRCDEFVDRNDKVRDRIKAALEEPVTDDCEWHSFLLGNAQGNEKLLADIAARAVLTNDPDLGNAAVSGAAALRLLPQVERERDDARAEVAALRAALTCPGSDYDPPTHRCVRCDNEVGP